ncbi:TetR/AcrR family transcriptional regulator [Sphingomonas sp. BN140010]|uniref:TetR/AcrR family transcriptional regulator n=1 Tax=Sphingomonas arvum TaxID=2992113 RepID=A0ABT3JCW2_9SPHN|nr:TetR/AcrR family transcriptional regulator [Sphingomonas sp. BN140010]MCW3796902.1 TetR/AcrR family transcriptional regulator [Sphingomonas sp. BN140010]
MTDKPVRRRLDPAVRRELILDEAARLVAEEGISAVNMERIGRQAGISKALVYNYFPSKQSLLTELLLREYNRFAAHGREAAQQATDFEELVRATTRAYFEYVDECGVLIQRLMSEPELAHVMRSADAEGRQRTVHIFIGAMVNEFGLAPELAATVTEVMMGLTGAAGEMLTRGVRNPAFMENLVVTLIMGGMKELNAEKAGTLAEV